LSFTFESFEDMHNFFKYAVDNYSESVQDKLQIIEIKNGFKLINGKRVED